MGFFPVCCELKVSSRYLLPARSRLRVYGRPRSRRRPGSCGHELGPHPPTSPTGTTRRPQRQLVALGSALDLLPVDAPAVLEPATAVVERVPPVAADLGSPLVLRRSVQAIWRDRPQERDGAGFVMLVDALLTAVGPAMHWQALPAPPHLQGGRNTLSEFWPTRSGTHSPPRLPRQRQQDITRHRPRSGTRPTHRERLP